MISSVNSRIIFIVRETMDLSQAKTLFFILMVTEGLMIVGCDPVRPCLQRRSPYFIADKEQCDKFYKCENGQSSVELCPDGLVYEPDGRGCFIPQRVDCGRRTNLQLPRGNAECPRLNGRYPIEKQCFVYKECEHGESAKINCPPGLVFDINQGVCEFPDMANRTGCSAEEILEFRCPHSSNTEMDQITLRFGDHDRLPKEGDCRHFYMCLKNGHPRLGGCPLGLVFNPSTFICDSPENVPGCEHHYTGTTN